MNHRVFPIKPRGTLRSIFKKIIITWICQAALLPSALGLGDIESILKHKHNIYILENADNFAEAPSKDKVDVVIMQIDTFTLCSDMEWPNLWHHWCLMHPRPSIQAAYTNTISTESERHFPCQGTNQRAEYKGGGGRKHKIYSVLKCKLARTKHTQTNRHPHSQCAHTTWLTHAHTCAHTLTQRTRTLFTQYGQSQISAPFPSRIHSIQLWSWRRYGSSWRRVCLRGIPDFCKN